MKKNIIDCCILIFKQPTPAPRLLLLRILWPAGACAPLGTDERCRRLAVVSTRSSRRVKRTFSGAAAAVAAAGAAEGVTAAGTAAAVVAVVVDGATGAGRCVGGDEGWLLPAPAPMTELTPRPAAAVAAAAAPDTTPDTAAAAAAAPRRDGVRGGSTYAVADGDATSRSAVEPVATGGGTCFAAAGEQGGGGPPANAPAGR